MKTLLIAPLVLALAACAGPPAVMQKEPVLSNRLACTRFAQAEIPGGHGAYGGFRDDAHPYYLQESKSTPAEKGRAFVDPYFQPGQKTFEVHAYRACLLRDRAPDNGT